MCGVHRYDCLVHDDQPPQKYSKIDVGTLIWYIYPIRPHYTQHMFNHFCLITTNIRRPRYIELNTFLLKWYIIIIIAVDEDYDKISCMSFHILFLSFHHIYDLLLYLAGTCNAWLATKNIPTKLTLKKKNK